MNADYSQILKEIYEETLELQGQGRVAAYIPALAGVNPKQYGIAIQTLQGESFQIGDALLPFSIQSISKVFTLTLAFQTLDEALWSRVGREPSGNAFNSLIQLETEHGIPRNPFINAGALVVADCLISHFPNPLAEIVQFARKLSDNPTVNFNTALANSEREAGFRNAAMVNLMKSFGTIHNEVNAVLDVYFHQCSLMMNCLDLAKAFLFLANGGVNPWNGRSILTGSQAKRINALMQVCGLYDDSGEFAFTVGLPGKSGVGGGIVALIPNSLAICVWAPELNERGSSLIGMKALELFTTKTGISIF
ncbi:MAG: glutaminase [Anaerolineales bacterium]|nr:glutaminase [Anaerolineales bacterium]